MDAAKEAHIAGNCRKRCSIVCTFLFWMVGQCPKMLKTSCGLVLLVCSWMFFKTLFLFKPDDLAPYE